MIGLPTIPPSRADDIKTFIQTRYDTLSTSGRRFACRSAIGAVWKSTIGTSNLLTSRDDYERLFEEILRDEFGGDRSRNDEQVIEYLASWLAGVASKHLGSGVDRTGRAISLEICASV